MSYILFNQTNYGDGIYLVGLFRTKQKAEEVRKELLLTATDEDSYKINKIDNLEKYTTTSIVGYYKENL
jgi:hypothetical protein